MGREMALKVNCNTFYLAQRRKILGRFIGQNCKIMLEYLFGFIVVLFKHQTYSCNSTENRYNCDFCCLSRTRRHLPVSSMQILHPCNFKSFQNIFWWRKQVSWTHNITCHHGCMSVRSQMNFLLNGNFLTVVTFLLGSLSTYFFR